MCIPSAQCHSLKERYHIADNGRLAYHHSHPMIDKKPFSYLRAGMDLYARDKTRGLRNKPRQKRDPRLEKGVGDTVPYQGMEPGVGQHHLQQV